MSPQRTTVKPWRGFLNLQKGDDEPLQAIAPYFMSACLLLCLCLVVCDTIYASDKPYDNTSSRAIKKIVFFGFQPALHPGEESQSVQSPLTGAVFEAEPVEENIARDLTDNFYKQLIEKMGGPIISPDQAKGVFYGIISKAPSSRDREIMPQMGRAFSADAVLAGYVYRWRERQGSGLAVSLPASVAFDLCFIEANTAQILWKGRYDKTQQPLSENIFDVRTFLEGKGKWMTAKELAKIGLLQFLNKLEKYEKGEGR